MAAAVSNMDKAEFRRLLQKLRPDISTNDRCIQYIWSFKDECDKLFDFFLEEMNRSSVNARARLLYFLEHCSGEMGSPAAPEQFNKRVVENINKLAQLSVPLHMYPFCMANVAALIRCVELFHRANYIQDLPKAIDSVNKLVAEMKQTAIHEHRQYFSNRDEVSRRIEEDRERQKRSRDIEEAVNIGSREEFKQAWKTTYMHSHDGYHIQHLNRYV